MSWFVFVVRLNDLFEPGDRDEVMTQLRAEGIGCNNYFPPIHLQPYMMERFGFKAGHVSGMRICGGPDAGAAVFGQMRAAQVMRVCDTLESILEKPLSSGRGGSSRPKYPPP